MPRGPIWGYCGRTMRTISWPTEYPCHRHWAAGPSPWMARPASLRFSQYVMVWGGEAAGETASRLTAEIFAANRDALLAAAPSNLEAAVQACVRQAHQTVGSSAPLGRRSGSTLALAVLTCRGIHCFNLGDSRIFCSRRGRFWQVTHDHNVWADHLRTGIPPSAGGQPDYRLTRCVGIGSPQSAESYPVIPGSCRLLLCSDGLTDMVSAQDISTILRETGSPSTAADRLVQAALQNGGLDNVTVLAVEIRRSWP